MALEKVPRSDHELAHAVHGPTYRANHTRIFGERRFPKIAETAPQEKPQEGLTPNPDYPDATHEIVLDPQQLTQP